MLNLKLKNSLYVIAFLWMTYALLACTGEEEKSEELEKAFELHLESLEIRKNVTEKLSKLTTDADSVFMEKNKIQLDSIQAALKDWDELFIEVPGFEHDHEGHDHHHHHDHNSGPQLTPTEHLDLQQYLLTEIKRILESINKL